MSVVLGVLGLLMTQGAYAQTQPQTQPQAQPAADESIDLKAIRQEYTTQLQIVQNRAFPKKHRFGIGLSASMISTDPFLNVKGFGGDLNFYISEMFALQALGWVDKVSPSTALKMFETNNGYTVNSNFPKWFAGVGLLWIPIYGKLNLLDSGIIYYDLHTGVHGGMRGTDSGNNVAFSWTIGQDIFLNRHFTLKVDYRLLFFKQKILEKVLPATLGNVLSEPTEFSHVMSLGIGYLF